MTVQGIIIFKEKPFNCVGGQQVGSNGGGEYVWVYSGDSIEEIKEKFNADYEYLKKSRDHNLVYAVLNYEDYYGSRIIKSRI